MTLCGHIQLGLIAALFCGGRLAAEDGYWAGTSGGSWAGAANWDPADGIAGGADNTAYFGFARETAIGGDATFTVSGTQTIGNLFFTTQCGPSSWDFTGGGSLMLASTFGLPQITLTSPTLQVSLKVLVTGAGGVEKDGPGMLVLSAQNTYEGETLVVGGGLNVAGSVGAGPVQVHNATLSGVGVINGPVTIGAGGGLSVGNAAPLTINNSLVLLPGSVTTVTLSPGGSGVAVKGLTGVSYGGTLVVNAPGGLLLGQSFSIFGSVPASGNFSAIEPPPGPWERWQMNPATGQLTVVSSASQPSFVSANVAGNQLACQVTGGPPGATGYLIASSDLSQPQSAWTRVSTNVFDMSGSYACASTLSASRGGQLYVAVMVVATP